MTNEPRQPTDAQRAELARLKAYFPCRIVWGAISKDGREWTACAAYTRHRMNQLARAGWSVWEVT